MQTTSMCTVCCSYIVQLMTTLICSFTTQKTAKYPRIYCIRLYCNVSLQISHKMTLGSMIMGLKHFFSYPFTSRYTIIRSFKLIHVDDFKYLLRVNFGRIFHLQTSCDFKFVIILVGTVHQTLSTQGLYTLKKLTRSHEN